MQQKTLNFALFIAIFVIIAGFSPSIALAAPLNFDADETITISSPSTALTVVSGSKADALQINATNIVVTLSSTTVSSFVISSASYDLLVDVSGSGGRASVSCYNSIDTATLYQETGSTVYTVTPSGNSCATRSTRGGGGGVTYAPPSASVALSLPVGGETLNAGQQMGITWSSANGAFTNFKVSYSADNGNNWTVLADSVTGSGTSFTWIVPSASTTQGLIKVEGIDANGSVLASDTSNAVFTVVGTTAAPPPVAPPPPATDSTAIGSYSSSAAIANTPDINTDKGLAAPTTGGQQPTTALCASGTLIKGSLPAVYYCGSDGKRYVFVNEKAYFSWYADFSTVLTISDADLALITIGGNVTYRPGSKMIKILSDPKVYAVSRGGILRWVTTEAIAARLYGVNWNKQIDDVPDSFFVNYTLGEPIAE